MIHSHENHHTELKHHEHESHSHEHDHSHDLEGGILQLFSPAIASFVILAIGLILDNFIQTKWFVGLFRFTWYFAAYIPVGFPVIKDAIISIKNGNFFSEFFLMSIATMGAFVLKEYPEAVAVMLFYTVGENFQSMAVTRAKSNIKNLLDQRPDTVTILEDNQTKIIQAKEVKVNHIIQLKPGEKLALDGILLSEKASFNTSALTGESKPDTKLMNDEVLAGMINQNTIALVKVTTSYEDSKLSKILELVQNASSQKAPTELFISKFARIYTPIIVALAIAITLIPALFLADYQFETWLYRALVFLVISCPCALVISIPLGYFGGIGAASRNGILFKGGNFIDLLAEIQQVVTDKTGTLTEGIFKVQEININTKFNEQEILDIVNIIESKTTHPIASAIHEYVGEINQNFQLTKIEEIAGKGLKAIINNDTYLVGNPKLLEQHSIPYPKEIDDIVFTIITITKNNDFVGYITIADQLKKDAKEAVKELHQMNIPITMLSGDKNTVVKEVARELTIVHAFGDLLPEDKLNYVKKLKANNKKVAFVGDGVNDAPVVAISDVGIAMGGLGSDATIETADVVIQDDHAIKIPLAIKISKATKKIVWQNIILAFGIKIIVLILGAGGLANMWEAVFADVGVALLAILNAVRIQNMNFRN